MKRKLPILLCSLLGFCLVLQYFVPHQESSNFFDRLNKWIRIISVFAFVIGLGSLVRVHLRRIAMKSEYWRYSLVVFAGLLLMPVAAVIDYATTQDPLANLPADSNLSVGDLSDDLHEDTLYVLKPIEPRDQVHNVLFCLCLKYRNYSFSKIF